MHHRGASPVNASAVSATSFVVGLHDSYAVATSPGYQHGIQVDLTPLGARMVLDVPMGLIANRIVQLDEILSRRVGFDVQHLGGLGPWKARFSWIDAFLTRGWPGLDRFRRPSSEPGAGSASRAVSGG